MRKKLKILLLRRHKMVAMAT